MKCPTRWQRLCVCARAAGPLLVLLALFLPTYAQDVAYSGSVQFSTGHYFFTDRTDSYYFLNGLEFSSGPFRLTGSLPIAAQSTPWISYGPIPIPSGGDQSGEVQQQIRQRGQMQGSGGNGSGGDSGSGGEGSVIELPTETLAYQTGIADPLIGVDVEVLREDIGTLGLRLGADVKLPVASPDDGFATGEWDYSGRVSLSTQASSRDSVFADVSYWAFGDMPDLAFKNAAAYSVGYGRILSPGRWSAVASVYGMSRILENSDPPVQVGFGLTRSFDLGRSLSFNAAVGLSETVPDFSLGIGWRLGL